MKPKPSRFIQTNMNEKWIANVDGLSNNAVVVLNRLIVRLSDDLCTRFEDGKTIGDFVSMGKNQITESIEELTLSDFIYRKHKVYHINPDYVWNRGITGDDRILRLNLIKKFEKESYAIKTNIIGRQHNRAQKHDDSDPNELPF